MLVLYSHYLDILRYIRFLLQSTAINKVQSYMKKWVPCMPKTKHLPPCALAWGSAPLLGRHRSEHTFVFPKHSPSGCSLALSSRHSKSHRLAAGKKEENIQHMWMLQKTPKVQLHWQFIVDMYLDTVLCISPWQERDKVLLPALIHYWRLDFLEKGLPFLCIPITGFYTFISY